MCEDGVAGELGGCALLKLGATGEEMAKNLYALLRTGEKTASLLIAIRPKQSGGVMAGVLNRLCRAFGAEA